MINASRMLVGENLNMGLENSANFVGNQVEFMGISLLTHERVFKPKKQTRFLVDRVLEIISENFSIDEKMNVVDMCTGTGNIAITLALKLPRAIIYGVDISEKAIEVAKNNADRHHLNARIRFEKGDLFEPLEYLRGQTDLIVCNPPYIPTEKIKFLDKSITENEPLEALDGGPFGLSFFIKIINSSFDFLKPGGFLAFEGGANQGQSIARLIRRKKCYSDPVITPCSCSGEEFITCCLLK